MTTRERQSLQCFFQTYRVGWLLIFPERIYSMAICRPLIDLQSTEYSAIRIQIGRLGVVDN
jgi:hypothetical protein